MIAWWEIVICLFFYFIFLWSARIVFTLIMVKVISLAISQKTDALKENIENLKRGMSNGGSNVS